MAKTPTTSTKDRIEDPVLIAGDGSLDAALAALKPFANLPILASQPDEAHPAFQIAVGMVRAARALFPDAFDADGNPIEPKAAPEADQDTGETLEGEVDVQPPADTTT